MSNKINIGILGAGTWGIALARMLPIIETVDEIVRGRIPVFDAIHALMSRALKSEIGIINFDESC